MYLLGGIDNSTTYMNDVWSSSDGKTWTQITDNATWPKRYGHAATVFNKKIWVMGGDNGSTLNDVWYSSNDNASSWTHTRALQKLCGRQEAVHRLQFLTGNYGLLLEMEAVEHLTHGTPVMTVLGQKSQLKTMKLQEAEWKVG